MRKVLLPIVSFATVLALSLGARATILTFDSPANLFSGNQSVSANPRAWDSSLPLYGDRVSALQMYPESIPSHTGFAYSYGGTVNDLTPHVGVSYGPGSESGVTSGANPYPVWWNDPNIQSRNFGDLRNAMYQLESTNLTLSVTLTADPHFHVLLQGLDLGGWDHTQNTISSLKVLAGPDVNHLTTQVELTNFAVNYSSDPVNSPNAASHIHEDFSSVSGAQVVRILMSGTASAMGDVAMDNIAFTQEELPEPTSASVIALGSGLLLLRRRMR